jgi:hypothetical protein
MEFPIWPSDSRIVRYRYPRHKEFATKACPSEVVWFRRLVFARQSSLAAFIRLLSRLTPEDKRRERWTEELASDAVLLGGHTLVLDAGMK